MLFRSGDDPSWTHCEKTASGRFLRADPTLIQLDLFDRWIAAPLYIS
jgi:hypothetical protein